MREISLTDEPLLTASALSRSSAIVRSVGTWAVAGSGGGVGRLAHGGGALQRWHGGAAEAWLGSVCGAHGTARHAWRVHALWSHRPRLKGVRRRGVDRHADAAGLGVAAPWRLEQVIHAFAHVDVQPREGVREDDLVEHTRERADLLGVHVLDQARPLLKPALRTVGGERGATAAEDGPVGARG